MLGRLGMTASVDLSLETHWSSPKLSNAPSLVASDSAVKMECEDLPEEPEEEEEEVGSKCLRKKIAS